METLASQLQGVRTAQAGDGGRDQLADLLFVVGVMLNPYGPVRNRTCSASTLRRPEMAGVTIAVWEKRLNFPLVVFHGAAASCAHQNRHVINLDRTNCKELPAVIDRAGGVPARRSQLQAQDGGKPLDIEERIEH